MAGSRPTSATFSSLLDLALQNEIFSAIGVPTDDVAVITVGPALDAVPPGIESEFFVTRAGTEFGATAVVLVPPSTFTVTIPTGAGVLERIRYTGAAPTWGNASGGQVLAFDVALPFP